MKVKKWIAGLCAALLVASLGGVMASCGSKDKGDDSLSIESTQASESGLEESQEPENSQASESESEESQVPENSENSEEQEPEKTTAIVKFDVNTTLQTNVVKDKTVDIGKRVSRPKAFILEDNPTNLQLYGWYEDAECTKLWDFKTGRVHADMTLYAKWVEQYEAHYYANGELLKTELVFKGDLLKEEATLVAGHKYLGSFLDAEYTIPLDYTQPISGTMNVYMKRSDGIYLSDHVEEGEKSSGGLSDYLAAYIGSYGIDADDNFIDEEGWVEEYTVTTNYESGAKQEACTYVNFGYAPTYGDPFVELSLSFDISKSQIIRLWFKNLGKADYLCAYFTTMLDTDGKYSETGPNYSQDFCYPNHTGDPGARLSLTEAQMNMDETAEWTYVDFNLYEIYKNGYSIWGTSPFLGALRIQANYKNVSEDDLSNIFLIKAIEGIYHEVPVEDSEEIATIIETAKSVDEETFFEAVDSQEENKYGFTFPKDYYTIEEVEGNAKVYHAPEGLFFYADNEVKGRETGINSGEFTAYVPEEKFIDLGVYTTLNITLRNYGYAKDLIVYLHNAEGATVKTTIEMSSRMTASKTYSVNLYGKSFMEGGLRAIEIIYTSLGVDNLILFEEISLGEFVPYDTVGINFNDKWCYGLESTDSVNVAFDGNRAGTTFIVKESGASIETPDKTYEATTDGYSQAALVYRLTLDSQITAVTVEYKINGAFTTPYTYVLDTEEKGKVKETTLPFVMEERGYVQAIRLTFEGTGNVLLKEIRYEVGETGLAYYQSYAAVYRGWADWYSGGAYEYDEKLQASIFTKDSSEILSASMYIGISRDNGHVIVPHTTYNVPVESGTKVKIVYQNKTDIQRVHFHLAFDKTEIGATDSAGYPVFYNYGLEIDSEMQEYEWSTLTIEVPEFYLGLYLGKTIIQFEGAQIAIRAVNIETPAQEEGNE